MFGTTFYHSLTRKYVTIFGTLFNDITIERPKDNNTVQTIKVPLTYSSQDKMLARLNSDPDLTRKVAAITPAMAFEVSAPKYDADRKLQTTLRRCMVTDTGVVHQFVGVPYNLEFVLRIYSREEEDGLRVLEQILPYFTPSMSITAKLIPELNYNVDIPISLDSVDFENQSYGDMDKRRTLIWTIRFTMKAEFAGPLDNSTSGGTTPGGGTQRKVIRIVHANIRDSKSRGILEEVHVEPGLTANGEPTSTRSNSIPVTEIRADDDFGFIVEINEGPDPHHE